MELFRIRELPILYEDEHIVVVDKPSGSLVHASGAPGQDNIVEHLQRLMKDPEIRPVHRLDRLTSGVLLLARSAAMARLYGNLFAASLPSKSYLAQVRGEVVADSGVIAKDLGKDLESEVAIRRKTVECGEKAITEFQTLERVDESSLLLLKPRTGRRHQLRVHLADMNHSIINDPIYDLGDAYYLALRFSTMVAAPMHLHALTLSMTLPCGLQQSFTAPLPTFAKAYAAALQNLAV